MKEFWNERYSQEDYAYGTEPNLYFQEQLVQYGRGRKLLLPAEGEGRNATYAALRGYEVTAFDISYTGRDKALKLARSKKVEINYMLGDIDALPLETETFDMTALIFAHFPAHLKASYHRQISTFLKPGGLLILEGFSKNHLRFSSENPEAGGPRQPGMLFSEEEILSDFSDFKILELKEEETSLQEGLYHNGRASVIRFTGEKQ